MSLVEYYSVIRSGQSEYLQEATQSILELEKNPDTFMSLFEIIESQEISFIRENACVSLSRMIEKHLSYVMNSQILDILKVLSIKVLDTESNMVIRHLILNSVEPIVQSKESSWEELYCYAESIYNNDSIQSLDNALCIFFMFVPKLSNADLMNNLPQYANLMSLAISKNDINLIKAAGDLFSQIINQLEMYLPDVLTGLYDKILEIFVKSLSQKNDIASILSVTLERCVTETGVINPISLMQFLLEYINENDVLPDKVSFVFSPVTKIIDYFSQDIKELLPAIGALAYRSASSCFVDDCTIAQNDIVFILTTIDIICTNTNSSKFFEQVKETLSGETPGQQYATLKFFLSFIEEAPEVASSNSSMILQFLVGCTSSENHHAVREEAFSVLNMFIMNVDAEIIDYSAKIIENSLLAFDTEDIELVKYSLYCLHAIIEKVSIPHDFVEPIWQHLYAISRIENPIFEDLIRAISALISSVREDILPFIDEVASVIFLAAEVDDVNHPLIKANGIVALGHLLDVAPQHLFDISSRILDAITSVVQSEDPIIASYAISAFCVLINTQIDGLQDILPIAIRTALKILDSELQIPNNGEEDEQEKAMDYVQALVQSMAFMKEVIKNHSKLLQEEQIALLPDLLVGILTMGYQTLIEETLKALYHFVVKFNQDVAEFLSKTVFLVDDLNPSTVASYFRLVKKFLNNSYSIPPEFISEILESIYNGLLRKLHCQTGEDEDEDLSENFSTKLMSNIYGLMSVIAQKLPRFFDLSKFIDSCKSSFQKELKYEMSAFSEVISGVFMGDHKSLPSLSKRASIKLLLQALKVCDCSVPPSPIVAIRILAQNDFSLVSKVFSEIISVLEEIISIENEGQAYYNSTMLCTASLLCTLNNVTSDGLSLSPYIQFIITLLPPSEPYQNEAENIYKFITNLLKQNSSVIQSFLQDVYIGLIRTLSLKDSSFANLKLTSDLVGEISQLCLRIISHDNSIIGLSLSDEMSLERLSKKLYQ